MKALVKELTGSDGILQRMVVITVLISVTAIVLASPADAIPFGNELPAYLHTNGGSIVPPALQALIDAAPK